MTRALITGITGQDGSYLAEHLLAKGFEVFGLARRESWFRPHCSSHLLDRITVVFGDISEGLDISAAVQACEPDQIYNLASQSRPAESWERVPETLLTNGLGATRVFESVRRHAPNCRIYHASSSEMFGSNPIAPQSEITPFLPLNPYAAAKVYAHNMARIYRERYGVFISCGILFNHESERRPLNFLSQKVCLGAACAALNISRSSETNEVGRPIVDDGRLALGNLEIEKDWGFAGDFVVAMGLMLQANVASDYVIGTGALHSLGDLCHAAYSSVGVDWHERVYSDPAFVRPIESRGLVADSSKALIELGWAPRVGFQSMVETMVQAQIRRLSGLPVAGHASRPI